MNGSSIKIGIDARLWDETGVGRYIRNLVLQLQKIDSQNNYVLFVRNKDFENISQQLLGTKCKIVRADIRWHTLEEQIKFAQVLYKEKLDLMHFPYFSFPYLYRKKFVITIHDLILHHYPTGQATTLPKFMYGAKLLGYKFLLQSAAKRAEKIITVSNATKKEIVEHLRVLEEKVIVTYEGVDQNLKSKLQPEVKNYFLYVGNAYPHKNLDRLIDAFSIFIHVQKSSDDIKLILAGKNDFFYKRLQKKVSAIGLDKNILFKHQISDRELSSLYNNAIALILPSLMEGFGLPAIEAMANKCLVIASDISSFHEICKDAAIYIDPNKTEFIANTMLKVYKDQKEYNGKKILGFERSKFFSWEKTAKETLNIYESCISV